jgi:hypothetical protein
VIRRRFLVAGVAAVLVCAVAFAVALSGSNVEPPATGAAAVVPGDALAYVHVSTDPNRTTVKDALKVGPLLPSYPVMAEQAIGRLSALVGGGSGVDFGRDIRPWLGREMALALLNTTTSTAGSELVLDVARPKRARAFVAHVGALPAGSYRGTKLYRYRSGTELAFVRHYLVLGQAASVQDAIDSSQGQIASLSSSGTYRRAASGEPAGRVIDAYFSLDGVRRLLIPQAGLLGALGTMLDEPALAGTTISLSASGKQAHLHVHSALITHGVAVRTFAPSLDQLLPSGTPFELDVAGLPNAAPRVLGAAASVGILGQVAPLLRRLGGALAGEGVNVGRIESLFSGETVVAVGPGAALTVVTRTADERATTTEIANLEIPLSQLFPAPLSGSGQVPQFTDRAVNGVSAHQLLLSAGLQLDYAVFHGLLVISTSLDGIGGVAKHARSLTSDAAYQATASHHPSQVTSLVFLDFSQLLNLAERTGLLRGARYRALAPDIQRIRAAGLDSTRGENDSTAELTLQIS